MHFLCSLFFFFSVLTCFGQEQKIPDSLLRAYKDEMKAVSNVFSKQYYPNRSFLYSLQETFFLQKIDSLAQPFLEVAHKYKTASSTKANDFIETEIRDINYFFDRMVLDYPYFHENYTGKKVQLSGRSQQRLNKHLADFNNPALLSSKDFQGYIEAFLRHASSIELKKAVYKKSDNKRLDAYLTLIPRFFRNKTCVDFWQFHFIYAHLEDWGSKNLDETVKKFLATCREPSYRKTIDSMYRESADSYKGHIIKTYKRVDGFNLDLHIFLPDSSFLNTKRPVMVYFSGGSWTKGTPEWDFYNCINYTKKGWIAVSVEYRVADRFETTPFEAVKDARSAIRWLRMNASVYPIDTNRIVASGNSAGGHLVLATALSSQVNQNTDNLNYSASPNLLLVNSGVYNLYNDSSTDWISKGAGAKDATKKISPHHLLERPLPPTLIIHGTNDQSVDYASAKAFADSLKEKSKIFEFHTLEGAPHHIWYDRRFSGNVASIRKAFLKKYGYE